MKNYFIGIITLVASISQIQLYSQTLCEGQTVIYGTTQYVCNHNPWVLVFEDDFDGDQLDLSNWYYISGGEHMRYCNDEQQYYTYGDNVELSEGKLKIITKEETLYAKVVDWKPENEQLECDGNDRGQNLRYFYYTSGNVETVKKFSFGKFEAQIKIPKGKGFWPAFWLFGGDPVYNELDIFEFWNEWVAMGTIYAPWLLSKVHNMNVFYDYDGDGDPSMCQTEYTGVDFSLLPHIFTVIWEEDRIEWYVDWNLKRTDFRHYTMLGQSVGCTIEDWTQYNMNLIYPVDPMHIILNLAIQSGDNSPDNSTTFPSHMEVDWVKYYQRHTCQNIAITNPLQYPLSEELYNAISGNTISVDCNYSVLEGQNLDLIACDNIILKPGFKSFLGSEFSGRIDQVNCGTTDGGSERTFINGSISEKQDGFNDVYEDGPYEPNQINYKRENLPCEIKIFPNPNNGSFKVEFGSINHQEYVINVINSHGEIVFSKINIESSSIDIDMKRFNAGIYILQLYNAKMDYIENHKIILF
jgi:beta-glucanase (GH16 family)